jgi:hypothetical protein
VSGFQYLMLGIGALAALGGLASLIQRIRTVVSGRIADGVVVDHKQTTNNAGRRSTVVYHSIYEFKDGGKTYRCQSSLALPQMTPTGTKVRVRYLPSDPQSTAEVDSFLAMWGFPVAMLGFGVLLALVGTGIIGN